MSEETRTPETDLVIPETAALTKVPQASVVEMLLDTAGTLKLTDEQRGVVFAKVDPDAVEIREDGIVYLPAVEYKQTLCEAFGLEWAIVPESPKPVEVDGVILWGFHLFVQGQPLAFAWGEQKYQKGSYMMSYGDAMEGAKSNAIMRLCKQIGVAQDLWRPSFIRRWKKENAEEYEGIDRQGKKRMMWRRLESTKQEEDEAGEDDETEQGADTDRFRRTAFLMVEYLQIDEARMKAECKEMFEVESRSELEPEQWVDYVAYLSGTMDEEQKTDYKRWLEVRSALKALLERGMDKKDLKFYLQTHFLRLDVVGHDIPEDLAQRLKRSGASDKYYASLQKAVQRAKEWAEAIGGQGEAEELLEHLGIAIQDPTNDSVNEFFKKMGVEAQEEGNYRLTDISPAMFEGWKDALGIPAPDPEPDPPPVSGGDPNLDAMPDVSEEHQGKLTDTTKEAIKAALIDFGDRRYQTTRSLTFQARAAQAIERDVERIGITELTEVEGMMVLESLLVEWKADLEKTEPAKDGGLTAAAQEDFAKGAVITSETVAREIIDDAPLGQGDPVEPSGEECCASEEQYAEMQELFNTLMPDQTYAMGTEAARDLIFAITGKRFKYLNTISGADASDVIHELKDKIGDMLAEAEAKAAANAPA